MNAELKAKWIAALRSGEFKQAREILQEDSRYCCLGVLCCITGIAIPPLGEQSGTYEKITDLVGMSLRSRCVEMNDMAEMSFPQIADWLETQP